MIPADSSDIRHDYQVLLNELKAYSPELLDKDRLLANGDRWARQIAKNLGLDAPYR